jgi:hypothetical protein
MKTINGAVLQVGDIVLTTSTEKVSAYIRGFTRSDISHAMICVESYSVIDANAEGVQARNTQRQIYDDECAVHILRPRQPLTPEQLKSVVDYARQHVGAEYSVGEAIRTFFGGRKDFTRKQFCSRLVAQAYASAGIKLVADPNYCSPHDIKNSPLLFEVAPSSRSVSKEEVAAWKGNEDATQSMRNAINSVLEAARTKSPGIQNLNDINEHLVEHPEDDAFILEAYRSSGYLDIWRTQPIKNPWLFDVTEMMRLPDPAGQMEEYCRATLADEARGPNRFIVNHGGYALLNKQYGFRTFAVLEELYGILASSQKRRAEVARTFLEAKGLIAPDVLTVLRPHTAEWFAALEVWNPPQAMMVRAAIAAMEGNLAVCSMCGDDPAKDYQLPPADRSPSGVYTLRLCDDCLSIRRGMGEPYEALPDD